MNKKHLIVYIIYCFCLLTDFSLFNKEEELWIDLPSSFIAIGGMIGFYNLYSVEYIPTIKESEFKKQYDKFINIEKFGIVINSRCCFASKNNKRYLFNIFSIGYVIFFENISVSLSLGLPSLHNFMDDASVKSLSTFESVRDSREYYSNISGRFLGALLGMPPNSKSVFFFNKIRPLIDISYIIPIHNKFFIGLNVSYFMAVYRPIMFYISFNYFKNNVSQLNYNMSVNNQGVILKNFKYRQQYMENKIDFDN